MRQVHSNVNTFTTTTIGQEHGFVELSGAILELIKIRITFFVGMSAIFGYLIATTGISLEMILPVVGIFLLSCASAAMNHFQERKTDALMHRTQKRPLPSGIIQPGSVLAIIMALASIGSFLILEFGNLQALILSWLAFLSYNVVYTPLKKVTPFAVIPGSFVGAFPVMAGWAAAGGNIFDPKLIAISTFFFIWQIPHFWLLMDIYDVDYRRAGFPTLINRLGERKSSILNFSLIAVLPWCSAFFISTEIVHNIFVYAAMMVLGAWLVISTLSILRKRGDRLANKAAFMKINVYVLAVTLVVMIDKVINLI
ncbi:MAG: protoheme IX farnesyltransferase [Candidatus Kryptoniota bacterium]